MPVEIIFSDEVMPMAPPEGEAAPDFSAFFEALSEPAIAPETKRPVTLEERLAFAYPSGAPAEIRQFFAWESRETGGDRRLVFGGPELIARQINRERNNAEPRLQAAERHLAEIEAKLAQLRFGYSAICEALDSPPSINASPREIGLLAVDKAGYERLLPEVEEAVAQARAEVDRAKLHAENWIVLTELSSVISGAVRPNDDLARWLGLEYGWQIAPAHVRAQREAEQRKTAEEEKARRAAFRKETEALHRKIEATLRVEAAEVAEVESLDFQGLVRRLGLHGLNEFRALLADWPNSRRDSYLVGLAIASLPLQRYENEASNRALVRIREILRFGEPIREEAAVGAETTNKGE